jgi:hypothetical protein
MIAVATDAPPFERVAHNTHSMTGQYRPLHAVSLKFELFRDSFLDFKK